MDQQQYDVIIIGAGVVGNAIARELSRYQLNIAVLEKELDVGCGNSNRNTGMLHAGFTYKPGSLKAICSVEGNQEFDQVAKELDVPFKRTGKMVVGFTQKDKENILKFKKIGEQNGVKGLELIDKKRIQELDASASGEFAMYSPYSGILDPIQYTIALAENAKMNGVTYYFNRKVSAIERIDENYKITTDHQIYRTRWVVNSAGMYATNISEMLGITGYVTKGFKGEYYVLDKRAGENLKVPVYPAPNENGGFATHATPTIDGNVLIGPDSYIVEDREDYTVTKVHLDGLIRDGLKMFEDVKPEYFIRSFAGIRWKRVNPETNEVMDFVLETREDVPNVVNLVGIESPGLTASLPLARRVVAKIQEKENLIANESFSPYRSGIIRFHEQSREKQQALIEEDPDYGEIICRCETITKAEIKKAIHNPLGVYTVTGIKNRTRAMMGRCQGGYCETRITAMIREELGKTQTQVIYQKEGSSMFVGSVRGDLL